MCCPVCSSTDTEPLDDGRTYCPTCRVVFTPEQPARLVDPEPRKRRDVDE